MSTAAPAIEAPNDVQVIQAKTSPWPDKARALVVDTDEQFATAGEDLKAIHALKREAESFFKPIRERTWSAHQETLAQEKRATGPLDEALGILKAKMSSFQVAKQRREDEERRRREQEAIDEARRKRDAELKQLEAEKASVEEYVAVAEAPLRVAVAPPAPPVQAAPKPSGIATIKGKWKGYVTDKEKLIAAIATRPHLVHLLDVNQAALNRYAESMQKAAALDGVEFRQDDPGIRPTGR